MTRKLSVYEQTHLARFSKSKIDINDYSETPVEYITGKVEFDHQVFVVNQDVLIPRIETEELVNLTFQNIENFNLKSSPNKRIKIKLADVGCGCGAIGICLAQRMIKHKIPFEMWMSDVTAKVIKVAQSNIDNLLTIKKKTKINDQLIFELANQSKIVLFVSDLLSQYPSTPFDFLVANLPYIPQSRINYLSDSVKNYEPHIALDGGEDGLSLISKFLTQAQQYLSPHGQILLEVDYTHDQSALKKITGDFQLKMIFDQFNRQRFVLLSR